MGTRNVTIIIADKETKVAQYCQWDGYPSGQGLDIIKFFRDTLASNPAQLTIFKQKVLNKTKFLSDSELKDLWKSAGAGDSGWVTMDVSEKFEQLYPSLHRNTGAEILDIINKSNDVVPLTDASDFVNDGLFCEWAYVVDLDKNKLEVYQGVYFKEGEAPPKIAKNRFTAAGGQVRLKKKFDLLNLPTNAEFCKKLGDSRE